jgi:hypothetical protein
VKNEAMNGYVYCSEIEVDKLKTALSHLFQEGDGSILRCVNNAAFCTFSPDNAASLVAKWDEGQVFNNRAELRWRHNGDSYYALLLSESSKESLIPRQPELAAVWKSVTGSPFTVVSQCNQPNHGFLLWGKRYANDRLWESRIPRSLQYPGFPSGNTVTPPRLAYRLYRDGAVVRWVRLLNLLEVKEDGSH